MLFSKSQKASLVFLFWANLAIGQTSNVNVLPVGDLNPMISTATRVPTPAKDVLADNVYISSEQIQQAAQTTLVELLQQQRGVQVTSSGGGNAASSVFLRGNANSQTIVLIDGVRSENSYQGGPTWGNLPLALIDHIEIVYGPQSSIYGSDAIGGVIQIFTKKGEGPLKVGASVGYGSNGTTISDASLYGATNGDKSIHYSLGVTQELSMGYPTVAGVGNTHSPSYSLFSNYPGTRTGYSKVGATGQLSQVWGRGHEIGLQFFQSKLNNQLPSLDYYKDGNGIPMVSQTVGQIGQYSIYSRDQINDVWSSRVQLTTSFENDSTIQTVNAPINNKQNIYTWQNDFKIGQDSLQAVLERRTQNVYSVSFIDPTGNGLANNVPSVLSADRVINSGALAYSLKRDANLLNLSARRDYFTGWGGQTTGSAAYGYFLTNNLRTNVSYGTGFRAPDISSLYLANYGNPNLLPEKSKNTEGGLYYESKSMDANVVIYNNTVQNLIAYASTNPPCTDAQVNAPPNYGCASNVAGYSKISGVSLGSTARLSDYSVRGSFDQMNPINQSTGNVLALRARQTGNLEFGYQGSQWQATINGTAVGRRYDSGNRALGGYSIMNAYSSYAITKDWSLFGRVNNIFNKYYQMNYGWNSPGVSVFVGARYAMQ